MPGAGCRVPGAGCRVPGAGCRVPGAGCRVPGAGCREGSSQSFSRPSRANGFRENGGQGNNPLDPARRKPWQTRGSGELTERLRSGLQSPAFPQKNQRLP
ncbi:hypothetical protein EO213_05630 [Paracoccus denitrificans]|nr:hypothetical protein EO213_05630 [Paracoccus denitrificans]